jgi:HlyD family secretion protein
MKNKKLIIIIVVVLALLGFAGFFIIRARQAAQSSTAYQTEDLARGNLVATVGATGTVRANQTALLSWQTSGTVNTVDVKVGDAVKANTILASLEPTSLSQSIILARADLVTAKRNLDDLKNSNSATAQAQLTLVNAQKAYDDAKKKSDNLNNKRATGEMVKYQEAQLSQAEDMVDRAQGAFNSVSDLAPNDPRYTSAYSNLYNAKRNRDKALATLNWYKGTPSDTDVAQIQANLALAQANLDDANREWERLKNGPAADDLIAAQARVDAIQATLDLERITAPIVGVITSADPKPGDQVVPGTSAFRVDDLTKLLVDVQVSEIDINSLQVGQDVHLTFDAIPEKEYHGIVREVGQVGSVAQGAVNFVVTVELTDPDEFVKTGMTAAVTITVNSLNDVILVPNRAVRFVDGKRVVYVLKNGTPTPVNIEIGASSDAYSVLTSGDLIVGDKIVLNPPVIFGGPGGMGGGGFGGN